MVTQAQLRQQGSQGLSGRSQRQAIVREEKRTRQPTQEELESNYQQQLSVLKAKNKQEGTEKISAKIKEEYDKFVEADKRYAQSTERSSKDYFDKVRNEIGFRLGALQQALGMAESGEYSAQDLIGYAGNLGQGRAQADEQSVKLKAEYQKELLKAQQIQVQPSQVSVSPSANIPVGYANNQIHDTYAKYQSQLTPQERKMSQYKQNEIITSNPAYQSELARITSKPEVQASMQKYSERIQTFKPVYSPTISDISPMASIKLQRGEVGTIFQRQTDTIKDSRGRSVPVFNTYTIDEKTGKERKATKEEMDYYRQETKPMYSAVEQIDRKTIEGTQQLLSQQRGKLYTERIRAGEQGVSYGNIIPEILVGAGTSLVGTGLFFKNVVTQPIQTIKNIPSGIKQTYSFITSGEGANVLRTEPAFATGFIGAEVGQQFLFGKAVGKVEIKTKIPNIKYKVEVIKPANIGKTPLSKTFVKEGTLTIDTGKKMYDIFEIPKPTEIQLLSLRRAKETQPITLDIKPSNELLWKISQQEARLRSGVDILKINKKGEIILREASKPKPKPYEPITFDIDTQPIRNQFNRLRSGVDILKIEKSGIKILEKKPKKEVVIEFRAFEPSIKKIKKLPEIKEPIVKKYVKGFGEIKVLDDIKPVGGEVVSRTGQVQILERPKVIQKQIEILKPIQDIREISISPEVRQLELIKPQELGEVRQTAWIIGKERGKEEQLQSELLGVPTREVTKEKIEEKNKQQIFIPLPKQTQPQVSLERERQVIKPLQLIKFLQPELQRERQISRVRQRERQIERQKYKELLRPKEILKRISQQKERPKTTFKDILGETFEVFKRTKGEDVSVGEEFSLGKAGEKFSKVLRESLSASGYVKEKRTGRKVSFRELAPFLGEGFAPSKVEPLRIIQRKEKRLGSGSEVFGIQSARRSKSKRRWFQ